MHRAIAKSCNTYFYSMGRKIGIDALSAVAHKLGLGEKFDLPVVSQSYGTYPDTAWKKRRFEKSPRLVERPDWTESDTLNAAIGQGFVILNPLQLAVMAARIASGRDVQPHLLLQKRPPAQPLPYSPEHLEVVRKAMWEVVNGDGTAGRSKLPLEGVSMGGKTGTAQVRRITGGQRGQSGDWKYRDHGLFVFFAPTENPRYAGSVVIDHGMGGSRAAAPVAKDVLTFLFDRPKAMQALVELEQGWGGTIAERTERQTRAYYASKGKTMPAPAGAAASANAANAGVSSQTVSPTAAGADVPTAAAAAGVPPAEPGNGTR
jgi:penicillin-binding protein 2